MPQPQPPPPSGQAYRGRLPKPQPQPQVTTGQSLRPFDAWNSSSTGHQRAETRGPQGWRESRVAKLHSQFRAGHTGGERISDRVGAGSKDFDERHGVLIPKEVRARAMSSVADMLRNPGTMQSRQRLRPGSSSGGYVSTAGGGRLCSPEKGDEARQRPGSGLGLGPMVADGDAGEGAQDLKEEESGMTMSSRGPPPPPLFMELVEGRRGVDDGQHAEAEAEPDATRKEQHEEVQQRKIFDGLVIYINGSTHPLISDHKLKRVLAENGARTSIHLGRRQVTHVILGKPSGPTGGAGGGLAGGKLEKEIRRVGGCGIKYVGVEWVLESLKAGKRLPEARFANLKVAPRGQQSVLGAFSKNS